MQLLVVHMADCGAMVALHVILVAQDDGHGLVAHGLVCQQNGLALVAHGTLAAVDEVDGAAQCLARGVVQHAVRNEQRVRVQAALADDVVEVQRALPVAQIARVDVQVAAVAGQVRGHAHVRLRSAQLYLAQHNARVGRLVERQVLEVLPRGVQRLLRADGHGRPLFRQHADEHARSAASGSTAPAGNDPVSALIVEGLGGAVNLSDVDCCATRLRCTVKDAALVKQDVLKASGASGVICKGDGVQVVYGPKVAVIKAKLEDYLENAPKTPAAHAAKDTVLSACLNGTVVPLADVKDEAFASGALGDGIAIEPTDGELVAPADGEISSTFETHHAVGMTTVDGAELLMHIGIDTVKLGGKHFTYLVNEGDKVKKGQPLIRFELEAIKAEGYPVTTPLIVCNTDDYAAVAAKASGTVKQGDALLELKH